MGIISERDGYVRKGVMTVGEALYFFHQAREVLGPDAPLRMADDLYVTSLEISPEFGCVYVSDPDQPEWRPPEAEAIGVGDAPLKAVFFEGREYPPEAVEKALA